MSRGINKVILFGRLTEIARDFLQKGATVYLEGRIQTRKYNDQSGNVKYTTEIIGNQMQMLGGKSPIPPPKKNKTKTTNEDKDKIPWDTPGDSPDWLGDPPF